MAAVMTPDELTDLLAREFPQSSHLGMVIEQAGDMTARLRMPVNDSHLRPGGTVSGPTMFTLVDLSFYVATLAMIGREPLTVTTNVSINYLRKPAIADLICEARILKLGRTLSVGDATLYSEGVAAPVAHASLTYSIPPPRAPT